VIADPIPEMFIHKTISQTLSLSSEKDVKLCKSFTIQELARVLPRILPKEEFLGSDKCLPINQLQKRLKNVNAADWLRTIWKFLASFIPANSVTTLPETTCTELLEPVLEWCLLPVLCARGNVLFPLSKASNVLARDNFCFYSNVLTILDTLSVAKPILSLITGVTNSPDVLRLLNGILGNVEKPETVVKALKDVLEYDASLLIGKLTIEEAHEVLLYFSNSINMSKITFKGNEEILKKLPFYETIYNKCIALCQTKVYVLPIQVPNDDLESWTNKESVIFLKEYQDISVLIKYLGCEKLSISKVYSSHIFRNFSILSTSAQDSHMNFVKNHVKQLKDLIKDSFNKNKEEHDQELVIMQQSLKKLPFIPSDSGTLLTAACFYDSRNTVFKVMEHRFPQGIFNQDDWLDFLKDCGLVYEITQDAFVIYVKKLERDALTADDSSFPNILQQSNILLQHFLSRTDNDDKFLIKIADINFISAHTVDSSLEELYSQFKNRQSRTNLNLVAFKGSSLAINEILVWTVQNLLPIKTDDVTLLSKKNLSTFLGTLGVIVKPSISMVLNHTVTLCNSLATKETLPPMVLHIMELIYTFLLDKVIDPDHVICETPCILIPGILFIRPCQLSIDMTDNQEIQPYLFKIPLELGKYAKLFVQLGASAKPLISQYAYILKTIYAKCGNGVQPLHPAEQSTVCRAICELFALEKNNRSRLNYCNASLGSDTNNSSAPQVQLFLPCTDERLHPSNEVVFMDNSFLAHRVGRDIGRPILIDLSKCGIPENVVKAVLRDLAKELKPMIFSEICTEQVSSTSSNAKDGELARKMKLKLKSKDFEYGFKRLLKHSLFRQPSVKEMELHEFDMLVSNMLSSANSIRLVTHQKVYTELWFEGKSLPSTRQTKMFFLEETNENGNHVTQIHISSDFDGNVLFFEKVSNLLIKHDKYMFYNILPYISEILQTQMNIQKTLDDHEIEECSQTFRQLKPFLHSLGTFVPLRFHHLLVQDRFRFYKGEVVAWERDDPADRECNNDPTYIFVEIIVRVVDGDDSLHCGLKAKYKIKIDMQGTEQIVQSSVLYAFERRENESKNVPPNRTPQGDENAQPSTSADQPRIQKEVINDFPTTIREIIKLLKIAWTMTEVERKKIIRRLWLRYHPDKNTPEYKDFYTAVFQRLQNLIKKLSEGKSIDDPANEEENEHAAKRSKPSADASKFWQNNGGEFGSDFFRNMGARARRHRNEREQYQQEYSQGQRGDNRSNWRGARDKGGSCGHNASHSTYREHFFNSFTTEPNPQIMEARRWFKQAENDMSAAENDGTMAHVSPAYEWMGYKYYRVRN